jgi:UDP-N-acetylmuramoyl-tripeptide--D-alanyl-D-alanine ligase
VVDKSKIPQNLNIGIIAVEDTLKALQDFAAWHRQQWKGVMVGITGTNGKTTTKEFLQTILSQKHPTLSTKGSLNNHFGVPLTLLELSEQHKYAVIEMGMNHYHEIENLVQIAVPDIVLVTNVGTGHIENFGSVEGIAKAKQEIYDFAPAKATRIYNLDNEWTALMRARAPGQCKVMTYSSYARDVDVSLKEKLLAQDFVEVQGVIGSDFGQAKIKAFGRQQVANAMAAATAALAVGLDAPLIWKGLSLCQSIWGRGQFVNLECGAQAMFDGYNANPESVALSIENFSKLKPASGRRFVVFGDMMELGEQSPSEHFKAGEKIALLQPEAVLIFGRWADQVEQGMRSHKFDKKAVVSSTYEEKLAIEFGAVLQPGDLILVKGSRGMGLERVLELWHPLNFDSKH